MTGSFLRQQREAVTVNWVRIQKNCMVLHAGLVFNAIQKFTELTEYVSSAFAVNSVVEFALICHIC